MSEAQADIVPQPRSKLARWYRSPLFSVVLAGLISFTQPGIWNALNATGAGGQQKPYLVNGANALTFGIMAFGCIFFSAFANKFGLKTTLIIGTLGYAPYSASLYVNNRYGTEWFVLFGGATCGIAASALWASEGAIALGYGDVRQRGRHTAIWLGLRELGQLIGASIQLSLNVRDGQRGKVSYTTYLVLIGLQCLGLPLALLVSPPEKIIRPDGTRLLDPTKKKAVLAELGRMWKLLQRKQMFLLLPILVGFNWNAVYIGLYQTAYFSVRARTLSSLVASIVSSIANVFWGGFYDIRCLRRPTLAKISWFTLATCMLAVLGWQVANEKRYASQDITIDWTSPEFGRAFASIVILRFLNESHYMLVYWILGAFFDDIEILTLAVGLVRSFESVGSAVSYGIGAVKSIHPLNNLIVAFALFGASLVPTSMAVFLVPDRPASADDLGSLSGHVCDSDPEVDDSRDDAKGVPVQATTVL